MACPVLSFNSIWLSPVQFIPTHLDPTLLLLLLLLLLSSILTSIPLLTLFVASSIFFSGLVWSGLVWSGLVSVFFPIQSNSTQLSIQFNSIQSNSIQFNSIQFNSIQSNPIQSNSLSPLLLLLPALPRLCPLSLILIPFCPFSLPSSLFYSFLFACSPMTKTLLGQLPIPYHPLSLSLSLLLLLLLSSILSSSIHTMACSFNPIQLDSTHPPLQFSPVQSISPHFDSTHPYLCLCLSLLLTPAPSILSSFLFNPIQSNSTQFNSIQFNSIQFI